MRCWWTGMKAQDLRISFCCGLLQLIKIGSHRKVKASDQTSSNIFPSWFSCACRGAPPWCQGWEKRALWFPAERRFTIDRQGRAECNSIGDYWATWKTRAARGNLWYDAMIYGKPSFVVPVCVDKKERKKKKDRDERRNWEELQCLFLAQLKVNVENQVPSWHGKMYANYRFLYYTCTPNL